MGNKRIVRPATDAPKAKSVQSLPAMPATPVTPVFPFNFNIKLAILAIISFIIYANTLGNQYCLDDGIVIEKNQYVQQGFAGIGKIMTTDAYDSYYKEMNAGQQLSGGRYRPLSEVIFAIEHAIFNESPTHSIAFERHLFSVICYMLAVVAIFYFLSKYLLKRFKLGEDMAFFATLLFAVHPIHTEVVANVKSLDEILSILFIALTFIFCLRYIDTHQFLSLVIGTVSFFLALLAKEYAVMLLLLLPLLIYLLRYKNFWELVFQCIPYFIVLAIYSGLRGRAVGFIGHTDQEPARFLRDPYLFTNIIFIMMLCIIPLLMVLLYKRKEIKPLIMHCIPFMVVMLIYMLVREHPPIPPYQKIMSSQEILDNPYLLATHTEKIATEIFVLGKYLWLLFIPYPLICDYSYAVIPYQHPFDIPVILTVLIYLGLFAWGISLLFKKKTMAFPVFFYLLCLSLVSNLLMDIGATMGERLIFHSSLGFTILISYAVFTLIKKWDINKKRILLLGLSSVLVIGFGYETMARNLDWKNDMTLFTHDVKLATNSTMLNGNAGARFIDMAQHASDSADRIHKLDTAIMYLRKSIFLHKRSAYVSSDLNMGDAYLALQMPDSAKYYWNIVKRAYPDYPNLQQYYAILSKLYLSIASRDGFHGNYAAATQEIYKAIRVDPNNADLWYNLGGAYFTWHKYDSAYYAWNITLRINPNYAEAKKGLSAIQVTKKTK